MTLINTDTLDVPSRGIACQGIINQATGFIDTSSLDVPSRGVAFEWIQILTGAAPPAPPETIIITLSPTIEGWIGFGKNSVWMQ